MSDKNPANRYATLYYRYLPAGFVNYACGVLVAADQLLNALAGGNPDMTISAHVGELEATGPYWKMLAAVIDWAFYPLDGPRHCYKAFLSEAGRSDSPGGDVARAVLGLMVFVACPVLGAAFRLYAYLRLLKAKVHL